MLETANLFHFPTKARMMTNRRFPWHYSPASFPRSPRGLRSSPRVSTASIRCLPSHHVRARNRTKNPHLQAINGDALVLLVMLVACASQGMWWSWLEPDSASTHIDKLHVIGAMGSDHHARHASRSTSSVSMSPTNLSRMSWCEKTTSPI